jgi:hypothetical protein
MNHQPICICLYFIPHCQWQDLLTRKVTAFKVTVSLIKKNISKVRSYVNEWPGKHRPEEIVSSKRPLALICPTSHIRRWCYDDRAVHKHGWLVRPGENHDFFFILHILFLMYVFSHAVRLFLVSFLPLKLSLPTTTSPGHIIHPLRTTTLTTTTTMAPSPYHDDNDANDDHCQCGPHHLFTYGPPP